MYEDIQDDVGSFSSSQGHDAEAAPLSTLYGAILARVESLTTDKNSIAEDIRAELDNLLLQLRLWATDIKVDTGSLDLLDREYYDEAAATRIHLQNVSLVLEKLEVDLLHGTLRDSKLRISFVKDLSVAIHDLAELAEPIQTYIDLHRGQGPLSRLKNAIFEREETRHRNGQARQDAQKSIYGSAYFDVNPKVPQHQQVDTSTVGRLDSQRDTAAYYIPNSTYQSLQGFSNYPSDMGHPRTDKYSHEYASSFSGSHQGVPTDAQNISHGIGGAFISTEMRIAESDYQQFQQNHLPIPYDPDETPKYDSELVIGSGEEQQSSSQDPRQHTSESVGFRPQNDAAKRSHDQALHDSNPHVSNATLTPPWSYEHTPEERVRMGLPRWEARATSADLTPTTRRWSQEYAPEERMRLGLPRWESEEAQRDYEPYQMAANKR